MELKPGTDQGTPRRSDLDEPQRPLTPLRVSSRRPQGTGADASSPALAETTIMATGVSPLSTPAIQDSDGPFLNGRTMSPSLSATSAGSSRPSRPTSPSRKRKVSERALGFLRRSAQLLPKVEQAREVEKASSGAPSKQGQGLSYQVRLQKGASSDRQKARGDDAQDPASSGVAAGPVTQEAVEAIPHSVSSEPSQTPDRTSALMAGWSTEMRETTSASAQSVPGHPDTGTGAPPSSQTQARQENDSLQARLQALVSTPSAPQAAKTEAHSTSMMSDATRASHADSEKAPPEGKELDSSFGIERKPRRASASHLSINTTGSDLSAGLNMPKRGPAALSSALSTPHLSSADRTTAALSQAADGGSRTALRKLVTTATTATTPPTARLQAHQRRVSIVPASTDPAPAVGATPVVPPDGALDVPIASASGVAESTPLGPMPDELPKQRPGIKVRIITWNMHDSLPKGDLEVLLGRVGAYVPPEEGWDVSYESDSEAEEEEEEEAETEGSQTAPAGENDERHQRSRPGKGKGVIGQEQVPRKDRIPPLPHNKDHPYHLVVVAGQECPWGDGRRIATGVGMAGELGDIARTKSKAVRDKPKPEKKEGEGLSSRSSIGDLKVKDHAFPPASPLNGTPAAPLTPGWNVAQGAAASGFPFGSSSGQAATTPGLGPMSPSPPDLPPPTPGGGLVDGFRENLNLSAGWGLSGKGWSDMCEDWLCRGPAAQAQATKFGIRRELSPVPHSPMPSGSDPVGANGQDHGLHEDVSLPSSPSPFLNSGGPKLKLRTDNLALKKISQSGSGHSPAARSEDHSSAEPSKTHELRRASVQGGLLAPPPTFTRNNSSSTLSEKSAKPDASPSPSSATAQPGCPDLSNQPRSSSPLPFGKDASENVQHHGWHLHGAHVHSPDSNPAAIGPYELLIKERMMGCYLAVYVWRGCRDRVRGVSRAHVKSGLLAGRVGNKGAVGISVKLGGTRMLFVNGHLAGECHTLRKHARTSDISLMHVALIIPFELIKPMKVVWQSA